MRWRRRGSRAAGDRALIALRAYAKLYPAELASSLIDGIRYTTAKHAP